jgi:hypothetical protein
MQKEKLDRKILLSCPASTPYLYQEGKDAVFVGTIREHLEKILKRKTNPLTGNWFCLKDGVKTAIEIPGDIRKVYESMQELESFGITPQISVEWSPGQGDFIRLCYAVSTT